MLAGKVACIAATTDREGLAVDARGRQVLTRKACPAVVYPCPSERQAGLANNQGPVDECQVVIAVSSATAHGVDISTGIGAAGSRSCHAGEYRFGFTRDQTGRGEPAHALHLSVVSDGTGVARHSRVGTVHGQGTILEAEGVVAASQSTGCDHIAASILGALAGAAVAEGAPEHAAGFIVDKAAVGYPIAANVGLTVVGLDGVVGLDIECHRRNCDGVAGAALRQIR